MSGGRTLGLPPGSAGFQPCHYPQLGRLQFPVKQSQPGGLPEISRVVESTRPPEKIYHSRAPSRPLGCASFADCFRESPSSTPRLISASPSGWSSKRIPSLRDVKILRIARGLFSYLPPGERLRIPACIEILVAIGPLASAVNASATGDSIRCTVSGYNSCQVVPS